VQQFVAEILVIHFTAAKAQRDLDLVTFIKEAAGCPHLHIIIMIIDHGPDLDFLEFDDLLLLAGFRKAFLFLELELAVIEDLGDWRLGIWRDLNKIKACFLGHGNGLAGRDNTDIFAGCIDQPDFAAVDSVVDLMGLVFGLRLGAAVDGRLARRHWAWGQTQVVKISCCFAPEMLHFPMEHGSGTGSIATNHREQKGLHQIMARVEFDAFEPDALLAFQHDGPPDDRLHTGFFWLGGFMSDMMGSKAEALADIARTTRRACLRFDYSGHGQSGGAFTDGTISRWLEQATHMFITHTKGRRIVVGSSMGGWLAMLLARKLEHEDPPAFRRISGLLLIAPAADMTRDLMWDHFSATQKTELQEEGMLHLASDYGAPYPITLRLIEDGKVHLLLSRGFHVSYPVRILQGVADTDVPPAHSLKTLDAIAGDDVSLQLIKGGDHRLSAPPYLRMIKDTALAMAERADGTGF
jgi:pimeloyl-ACP methyl ester carboxylesterase